jgi:hypothetical protein
MLNKEVFEDFERYLILDFRSKRLNFGFDKNKVFIYSELEIHFESTSCGLSLEITKTIVNTP